MSRGFKLVISILAILFGLGFGTLIQDPPLFWLIRLVGLGGLLYLIFIYKEKPALSTDVETIPNPKSILKSFIEILFVLGLIFFVPYFLLHLSFTSGVFEGGLVYIYLLSLLVSISSLGIGTLLYLFYSRPLIIASMGLWALIVTVFLNYNNLSLYNRQWIPLLLTAGLLSVIFRRYFKKNYIYIFVTFIYLYFLVFGDVVNFLLGIG